MRGCRGDVSEERGGGGISTRGRLMSRWSTVPSEIFSFFRRANMRYCGREGIRRFTWQQGGDWDTLTCLTWESTSPPTATAPTLASTFSPLLLTASQDIPLPHLHPYHYPYPQCLWVYAVPAQFSK
eukprot:746103-Hanusia_phi.AAC.5